MTRRSRLWWVALALTALGFVTLVLGAGMIGPFILFAIPFLALVGFAFGPLVSILREEPTCARCGRTLADVVAAPAPARAEHLLHPSHGQRAGA
ncbi:MAG: hypothetical protein KF729_10165 [Sandaracinaceae bacterium]|nr:hypothetical protein [Sandaracinaceae bacterium]